MIQNLEKLKKLRELKKIIPLVAILLFAACSNEEEQATTTLLTLSAQMDAPQTRATLSNTWDGTEQVQVSISGNAATVFTAAADGTLSPTTPQYWQTQTITAKAWYPAGWAMQADQSTAGKLQTTDFIFAPEVTGITLANYTDVDKKLTFYHKTAKVTANLIAGADVSSVSGATVSFYGYTSGTIDYDNGTISGSGNGWISSCNTSGSSYTALLIPQAMTSGTDFIKVSLGGFDYFYKLPANQTLEAGKAYTYNITVNKTSITVSMQNIAVWGSGETHTIAGNGAYIDVSRNDVPSGDGWTYAGNVFTINKNGSYTFTGTSTLNRIEVASGVTADIALCNAEIDISSLQLNRCAFLMVGATVRLMLIGSNKLYSANALAGITTQGTGVLTITGAGSLEVKGGNSAAGIGGGQGNPNGKIYIDGGTVTAIGSTTAIGGGNSNHGIVQVRAASYTYWTNTAQSDPGGQGILSSSTPYATNGANKFVKIVCD